MKFIKIYLLSLLVIVAISLSSCVENYSNGERVGFVTQFSQTGLVFKTYEGHLNVTQTGMNSSTGFDFSIENPVVASQVEQALKDGKQVKLTYHEVGGLSNFMSNRGETDHFVTQVAIVE